MYDHVRSQRSSQVANELKGYLKRAGDTKKNTEYTYRKKRYVVFNGDAFQIIP